jgi:hypothetical protein
MIYMALACRCLIGLVFAVSAFSKVRSAAAFRDFSSWLNGLPLPATRGRPAAAVLAGTEVAIVALLLLPFGWTARAGLTLAAVTLAVFAAGTLLAVRRGVRAPCQCFGASSRPLGMRHAARDVLMCAAAAAGAVGGGASGAPPAGVVLSLAAGAVAAMFVVFLDDITALFA